MKIVCTSDLHGHLPVIPECDLLLIAGDVCPVTNHRLEYQRQWLDTTYRRWLKSCPARKIVGVWGNHDGIAQQRPEWVPELPWTVLIDELLEWEGVRIYGLPWQLRFYDWAFNLDEPALSEKYRRIPDCDVIVSHGPPRGFGDLTVDGEQTGCQAFSDKIEEICPALVVWGHIHEAAGQWDHPTTLSKLVNASYLNERYRVANRPTVVELP